jgi:hypothetical protein
MIKAVEEGKKVVYLHGMNKEDKEALVAQMEKHERGIKQLQGMRDTAKIRQAFNGVFSIPYEDYLLYGELT